MNCHECNKDFNKVNAFRGTKTSWAMFECPHCLQIYAEPFVPNGIPNAVHKDSSVIVLPLDKFPSITDTGPQYKKSDLFVPGKWEHNGYKMDGKVECDSLTDIDIRTLAHLIQKKTDFKIVYGIPKGGARLACALAKYVDPDSRIVLIVDDVLATGASMIWAWRKMRPHVTFDSDIKGVVIYSRNKVPNWITPVWRTGGFFE